MRIETAVILRRSVSGLRATLFTAAIFVLSTGRAGAAGPAPVGPAFLLSICKTCSERNPQVAGAPTGKFLTAYDIRTIADGPIVQARLFKASGLPSGPPTRPQTTADPSQFDAAVASNAAGAYVVAWSTVDGATHNSEIFAQRYDLDGKPVGTTIAVSLDPLNVRALDTRPAVAMAADGGFVISWVRLIPPDETDPGASIFSRRFSPAGVALAAPIKVSSGLISGARPSVCIDSVKRAVVAWTTLDEIRPFEPSFLGVTFRRLSAAGAGLGGQVAVAAPKIADSHVAVSCGAGSTFVVAWESDQAPARASFDVLAQRYTRNAVRNGTPLVVTGPTAQGPRAPAITHDAAGNFVILWQERSSARRGIFGQRYTTAGAKAAAEFSVIVSTSAHDEPAAPQVSAAGPANAFVAVWSNFDALRGRRFKIVP